MNKLVLTFFLFLISNTWASECGLDRGPVVLYKDNVIKFTHTSRDFEGIHHSPTEELIKIDVKKVFNLKTNPDLKKTSQDKKFLKRALGKGKEIRLEETKKFTYKVVRKVIGSVNFSFTTSINANNEKEMTIQSNGYSHGFVQTTIKLKKQTLPSGGSRISVSAVSYLKKSTYDALKNKLPFKLFTLGNPINFIKKEVLSQLDFISKELERQ